jgi:hypothetical protein
MLVTYSYANLTIYIRISSLKYKVSARPRRWSALLPSHVQKQGAWGGGHGIAVICGTRRITEAWHAVFFYYTFSNKYLWNPPGQVLRTFALNLTVLTANNRKVATKWASGGLELRRRFCMLKQIEWDEVIKVQLFLSWPASRGLQPKGQGRYGP